MRPPALISRIGAALGRFARDTAGNYTVEAVLIFPLLVWGYLGMWIFYDAFRQQNVNLKASYTIGDMLSREQSVNGITPAYVAGLNEVLDFLTVSRHPNRLRVTVVRFDADEDRHFLEWSEGTAGMPDYDQSGVDLHLHAEIPVLADGATAIVLQTETDYEPIADVGLPAVTFDNLVVTAPRFVPRLVCKDC